MANLLQAVWCSAIERLLGIQVEKKAQVCDRASKLTGHLMISEVSNELRAADFKQIGIARGWVRICSDFFMSDSRQSG